MIDARLVGRGVGIVILLLLATVFVLAAIGLLSSTPGNEITGAGIKRNSSVYIEMHDGVKIAADIWLPEDLESGQRIPTTLRFTRYVREMESGFVRRIALGLGLEGVHPILSLFNRAGYAVVLVDARGSGASTGRRTSEISPDEVSDMGAVTEWVTQQSWSDGKVVAFGVSYVGTTSEMLTVNQHSAVKAVMPLFSDFDGYRGLIRPGGVFANKFVSDWGRANQYSDSNDICEGREGLGCTLSKLWYKGIKPVDADKGGKQLDKIVAQRNNYDINFTLTPLTNIDDSVNNWTMEDSFPAGNSDAINQSDVPMFVEVSWFDAATVDGAIARFNSFSNHQQLVINPFNHGGSKNADPFKPVDTKVKPSIYEQYQRRLKIFDNILKTGKPTNAEKSIRYFTMAENVWKTTNVWPPKGIEKRRWYMGSNFSLVDEPPVDKDASDKYLIDFSASTGTQNRWLANLGGGRDIVYPDRAEEDKKLLTYDSKPLTENMEITGVPIVALQLSSTRNDGALHVYLEDIAPDGRVTYITEGILRVSHRNISTEEPPYYMEGPYHSFKQQDAVLLEEGEVTEVQIGMITTSVMIKAGHRIRIAIAGHDSSVFERIPKEGSSQLTIYRNIEKMSYVDFPVVNNRPNKSFSKKESVYAQ